MGVQRCKTRSISFVAVDVHLEVDATLTVEAGHTIAVEARHHITAGGRVERRQVDPDVERFVAAWPSAEPEHDYKKCNRYQ